MLAEGKISVDEAEKLLTAISSEEPFSKEKSKDSTKNAKPDFKYLRIVVEPGSDSEKQEKVNIRVPAKLIRAGLKWAAFMPKHTRSHINHAMKEKGIEMDFDKMNPEDIEELVTHLNDFSINVEGKEKVRIYCE